MSEFTFDGAWTAMVTPFAGDRTIDQDALRRNIDFQVGQGISGILPVGTTGESPVLSWKEHEEVIDKSIEFAAGRTRVLAGSGSNSTREAIDGAKHAHESGADAVLLVDCYYNGPSSLELRKEYYEAVLDAVPGVHVVPYVIPGRTGCELAVEDLAILAANYEGVHAVKEATGNIERMKRTRDLCGPEFQIMSGDDDVTFKIMTDPEIRASGVISVMSNIAPAAIEKMTRAILESRMDEAARLLDALSPLFGIVTVKVENEREISPGRKITVTDKFRNPQAIKTAMNGLGMHCGPCRRPLGRMTRAGVAVVRAALRETHRKDPSILKPIEDAYGVKIQQRLDDDVIWSALAY